MDGEGDKLRGYRRRVELKRRRILALIATSAFGSLVSDVAGAAPQAKRSPSKAKPAPSQAKLRNPPKLRRFKKLSRGTIKARKLPPQTGKLEVSRVQVGRKTKEKYLDLLRVIPPGKPAEVAAFVRHTASAKASVPVQVQIDGKTLTNKALSATDKKELSSAVRWTPKKAGKYMVKVVAKPGGALAESGGDLADNAQEFPVVVDQWGTWAEEFIDAVSKAVGMWCLKAKFKDIKIMAVSAIGTPGCLDGPSLESDIKMFLAGSSMPKAIKAGLAKAYATQFNAWRKKVTVPGLPWYPAFAAFPGPMAPPMPNIPMPLIACVSSAVVEIASPTPIVSRMRAELGSDANPDAARIAIEDLGTILSLRALIWLASSQVMLVLGKGPVPTFAPPYVPVGPVVNGDVISTPGHLSNNTGF